MDPLTVSMLIAGGQTAAGAIARGGPKRQYKWNKKLAEDQNAMNRANQQWVLEQNKRLAEEQRMYDSPAQQMARFKEAGLNPHLIYGQGNPGNMGSPVQVGGTPGANFGSVDASFPDIGGAFTNSMLAQSQLGLNSARMAESSLRQQAIAIQNDIAKTNPMLNPKVYESVVNSTIAVANLKEEESNQWSKKRIRSERGEGLDIVITKSSRIADKIEAEVESMTQRLGLNTIDLEIKNKILESKEFENAVKEIQASWLKDGDITPEHIRQGLMLILTKMLGR